MNPLLRSCRARPHWFAAALIGAALAFAVFIRVQAQTGAPAPTPTPAAVEIGEALPAPAGGLPALWEVAPASTEEVVAPLEALPVPADGKRYTSTLVLQAGKTYYLRIVGSFVWGGCDAVNCPGGDPEYLRYGDASYRTGNHWHNLDTYSDYVGLIINGSRYRSPTYQSTHAYTVGIAGNGQKLWLQVLDCSYCYPDDAYNFWVEIYERIPPAAEVIRIKPFMQRSLSIGYANWGGDKIGETAYTLCGIGCYISSWAMVLDAYGFMGVPNRHTNPREMNRWMSDSSHYGYDADGAAYHVRINEYASDFLRGSYVSVRPFVQEDGTNDAVVNAKLAEGIPVLLNVNSGRHWVVAFGRTVSTGGQPTWYIYDPRWCDESIIANLFTLATRYSGSYTRYAYMDLETAPALSASGTMTESDASSTIALNNVDAFLVTDPAGRRAGRDPQSGAVYNDIPGGVYYEESVQMNEEGTEFSPLSPMFYTYSPQEGQYGVSVSSAAATTYTVDVVAADPQGVVSAQKISDAVEAGSTNLYVADLAAPGEQDLALPMEVVLDQTVGASPSVCAGADSAAVLAGTTVYSCYTVRNTGGVTVTSHTLANSSQGEVANSIPYTLGPGQSVNTVALGWVISQTVDVQSTVAATWTAALEPVSAGIAVSATAAAQIFVVEARLDVQLSVGDTADVCANAASITVKPDEALYLCVRMENSGAVALTNIDVHLRESVLSLGAVTLLPGESVELTAASHPELGPVYVSASESPRAQVRVDLAGGVLGQYVPEPSNPVEIDLDTTQELLLPLILRQ